MRIAPGRALVVAVAALGALVAGPAGQGAAQDAPATLTVPASAGMTLASFNKRPFTPSVTCTVRCEVSVEVDVSADDADLIQLPAGLHGAVASGAGAQLEPGEQHAFKLSFPGIADNTLINAAQIPSKRSLPIHVLAHVQWFEPDTSTDNPDDGVERSRDLVVDRSLGWGSKADRHGRSPRREIVRIDGPRRVSVRAKSVTFRVHVKPGLGDIFLFESMLGPGFRRGPAGHEHIINDVAGGGRTGADSQRVYHDHTLFATFPLASLRAPDAKRFLRGVAKHVPTKGVVSFLVLHRDATHRQDEGRFYFTFTK